MKRFLAVLLLSVLLLSGCSLLPRASGMPKHREFDSALYLSEVSCAGSYYKIENGVLYGWGSNDCGQLGNGEQEPLETQYSEQNRIKLAENVIHVSAGQRYALWLTADGTLYGCGDTSYGQLLEAPEGNRAHAFVLSPKLLMEEVSYASAGLGHVIALKKDNSAWTWGWNLDGALGTGKTERELPFSAKPFKVLEDGVYAAAGLYVSAVIKSDSTLWMWGNNSAGQCGDGTTGNGMATISDNNILEPKKILDRVETVWFGSGTDSNHPSDPTATFARCYDIPNLWAWGEGYSAKAEQIPLQAGETRE